MVHDLEAGGSQDVSDAIVHAVLKQQVLVLGMQPRGEGVHRHPIDLGREGGPSAHGAPNGVGQTLGGRALDHVAVDPSPQEREDLGGVGVGGEDHDASGRAHRSDQARGLEATAGHPQIEQGHIGVHVVGQLHRAVGVAGSAGHIEALEVQHHAQVLENMRLVVREDDGDRSARWLHLHPFSLVQ